MIMVPEKELKRRDISWRGFLNRVSFRGSSDFITRYINSKKQSDWYRVSRMRKKLGGFREIYSYNIKNNGLLREYHKAVIYDFTHNVLLREDAPNYVHGFLNSKSIKTNAQNHIGKKYVVTYDIKDFFVTISTDMISNALKNAGFIKIHKDLSKSVTVDGILREGLITSPDLSNLVFYEYDKKIKEIADKYNVCYTRYADDMTFSTNGEIENFNADFNEYFLSENIPFSINQAKTKIQRRGHRQYVTGLTVFDHEFPRVSRRYKKNIRLELYMLKKIGATKLYRNAREDESTRLLFLYGQINWVQSIEERIGLKFREQLDNYYAIWEEGQSSMHNNKIKK